MNFRRILGLGVSLLALTFGSARAAAPAVPVNFKVSTLVDSSHEGPDRTRAFITAGTKRISFYQPPGSEISAAPDSLTIFLAKRGLNGQFTVVNSSFKAGADFVAGTQTFYDAAKATIPTGADEVAFKGSDFEGYAVSQRKGLGLEWSYSLLGKPTHRQVAYIDVDSEHQVCLTILADEESWADTIALAHSFMNSWYWVDEVKGQLGTP